VSSIIQRGEFVPVESVWAAGGDVQREKNRGKEDEKADVSAEEPGNQ